MKKPLTEIIKDPLRRANLEERFWPKVSKAGPDECWDWVAKAKHPYGYGRMTAGRGINLKAHQIAWSLANGEIPSGRSVLHTCDRPVCCNPKHLFLGSQVDNMSDAMSKGRISMPPIRRGSDHHNTKLSNDDIAAIRADWRPASALAAQYKVSEKTIYRVRWGQRTES